MAQKQPYLIRVPADDLVSAVVVDVARRLVVSALAGERMADATVDFVAPFVEFVVAADFAAKPAVDDAVADCCIGSARFAGQSRYCAAAGD